MAVLAYLLLAVAPVLVALGPPRPAGRGFWLELSLALGFVGLGQIGVQLALIARFQRISRPFGIDLVMQYHRHLGVLATLMVLVHPALLWWERPSLWRQLLPGGGAGAALGTGVWSTGAILLLIVLSFWRRPLGLGYEAWRLSHALLGIAALVLALAHVSLAGAYVATPWKHLALSLWCAAFVGLIAFLRLIKPIALARRPWQVVEVRPDIRGCWTLALAPLGHPGLPFAPGQFAWLKVGVSPWSLREHPLSFSSSAEHPERLEFGIKEAGDFTRTVGALRPGTKAFLDGPHGSFSCDFHATPGFLLVAGGIGITPILSMLRTLADRDDRHPHALVYACNRWDRIVFRGEIEALRDRLDLAVTYVLEAGHEGWTGPVGYIGRQTLESHLGTEPAKRQVFVCGPDPMMDAVEALLRECGVPNRRVTMERFNLV
ncbi:MAG TPA: ferric reductase-like transmembrane domain-containing protein [Thermoanaerobaculia bacterium]|nr:ferric reductase-like transmembrane domain-containing protein [Thermoanaerobaculia bacterium]